MIQRHKEKKPSPSLAVVDRNIRALIERREVEDSEQRWQERLAAAITRFMGSMTFIGLHLVVYGTWSVISLGWVPGIARNESQLATISLVASVEALFLSSFILITQQRMMVQSERRADLTLQISLLAEHEVTRLISMTRQMAKRMGIEEADAPDLEGLARDVAPEEVLEHLNQCEAETKQAGD
jgi:uncharacterized membrane protein